METIYEGAKETAKKIRVALKETFPGVKFSVRSQTYSGGSSVNVSWTDLPLREDVEEVVNRFKSGSFDGMTDMYENSGYIENGVRYVGAKYISCSRELSDEYRAEIETYLHANYEVSKNHYEYYRYMNKAEKEMIEAAKQETTQEEASETIETVQETNATDVTLQVVLNEKLNGIELYFSSRPSQNVRKMLSENGFRWSKRGFWYAKQTQERLSLVDAIQSLLVETNQLVYNVLADTEELMQEEEVLEDTNNTN